MTTRWPGSREISVSVQTLPPSRVKLLVETGFTMGPTELELLAAACGAPSAVCAASRTAGISAGVRKQAKKRERLEFAAWFSCPGRAALVFVAKGGSAGK